MLIVQLQDIIIMIYEGLTIRKPVITTARYFTKHCVPHVRFFFFFFLDFAMEEQHDYTESKIRSHFLIITRIILSMQCSEVYFDEQTRKRITI